MKYEISIHAPARGATELAKRKVDVAQISIHAPARGATMQSIYIRLAIYYFNPRSREGSDTGGNLVITLPADFNPRSREGSDYQRLPP